MIALSYLLTLDQPLLATDPGGEPNSSVSRSYIPGTLLRGMLAGRYLQRFQPPDPAADPTFCRLFLDGTTCFLHAYPAGERMTRTLPTPRSLMTHKGMPEPTHCYDEALLDLDDPSIRDDIEEAGELKPLNKPFIADRGESITSYDPDITVNIHIQRNRPHGRALPAKDGQRRGEVFRYEALAAGQKFVAIILADDGDQALLGELLGHGVAHLGRSRSAGYGRVTIAPLPIAPRSMGTNWREFASPIIPIDRDEEALIWLLSDTILEDEYGQPLLQLNNDTLTTILGTPIELLSAFTTAISVGGFNGAWRLPLRQSVALAAGSILRVRLPEGLSTTRIAQIEERGLGLRRSEGYGRVAIRPQRENKELAIVSQKSMRSASIELSALSHALAQNLADRRLARQIDEKLPDYAHTHGIMPAKGTPSIAPAQLARVAGLVRQALPDGNIEPVQSFFADQRSRARDQFDAVRLRSGQRLSDWIVEILTNPERVWAELNLRESDRQQLSVARHAPQIDDLLTRRTALRLIIAVLATERERQRREQQQLAQGGAAQ
ncbi:MAG: CRISPR-associated RAMP protein Csx10 [Roseiflexaceae bacterium]